MWNETDVDKIRNTNSDFMLSLMHNTIWNWCTESQKNKLFLMQINNASILSEERGKKLSQIGITRI